VGVKPTETQILTRRWSISEQMGEKTRIPKEYGCLLRKQPNDNLTD
jgi:hypothetical protein